MRWVIPVVLLVMSCTSSRSEPRNERRNEQRAQPSEGADDESCEEDHVETYEEGCEGEAVPLCMPPAPDPNPSQWCTCEGETVESTSKHPPSKIRYRHEGPCKIHGPRGAPHGGKTAPDAANP